MELSSCSRVIFPRDPGCKRQVDVKTKSIIVETVHKVPDDDIWDSEPVIWED